VSACLRDGQFFGAAFPEPDEAAPYGAAEPGFTPPPIATRSDKSSGAFLEWMAGKATREKVRARNRAYRARKAAGLGAPTNTGLESQGNAAAAQI